MLSAAEINAKRKELLKHAGFYSLTMVDRVAGFTAVLKELAALQDNVSAMVRADENPRRVLLNTISKLIDDYGVQATLTICFERFGTRDIESLSDSDLEKLRFTLTARVQAKKRAAKKKMGDQIQNVNRVPEEAEIPF